MRLNIYTHVSKTTFLLLLTAAVSLLSGGVSTWHPLFTLCDNRYFQIAVTGVGFLYTMYAIHIHFWEEKVNL